MPSSQHKRQTGSRLSIAIQALGVTQAEIARKFDISTSKLGNWIRGDNYPDPYFIAQFCDRYGVSADWIYRGLTTSMSGALGDALWAAERASAGPDTGPGRREV